MCTVWAALFLFLSPFSFRYRFATLLRTPSPHTHPSLSSICPFPRLSTAFPFSSLPPSNIPSRRYARSFPTLRLRPSFFRSARPFSLVTSSSFALSIFLLLLSPSPLSSRFFLSLMPRLLSSFRSSATTDSSLLTPSSRAAFYLPPFRPSLHTPAASVETARFFPPVSSAPTFFTPFFSPSPPFSDGCPCAALPPAIGISPRASAPSPSLPCRTYAHGLSLPLGPVYPPPFSSSHSSTSRFPLASLSFFPAFHPRLCLTLFRLTPSPTPCGSYLFDFFFTATRPPTDAARRRPFSIGTLFSTIGSTTYSRTHVRSRSLREWERRRDKEGRKEGACKRGRKRRTDGCTRKGRVSGWVVERGGRGWVVGKG